MADLLRADMKAGALGLSSGLEYDPGIYSEPARAGRARQAVAPFGGRYISHVRSEDRTFWKAIEEAIDIGREAAIPVQISHLKLAMRSLWGQTDRLIALLDAARASGRRGDGRHLSLHLLAGRHDRALSEARLRRTAASAEFALREVTSPEGLLIARFAKDRSLRRQDARRDRHAARRGSAQGDDGHDPRERRATSASWRPAWTSATSSR